MPPSGNRIGFQDADPPWIASDTEFGLTEDLLPVICYVGAIDWPGDQSKQARIGPLCELLRPGIDIEVYRWHAVAYIADLVDQCLFSIRVFILRNYSFTICPLATLSLIAIVIRWVSKASA